MRFSAVSPSTSTVMQAPEKIKFSVYCLVHVDFYCKFLTKKNIIRRKKGHRNVFFAIYRNGTGGRRISIQSLNFLPIYGGYEPSTNRFIVLARPTTEAGGLDSLESIPGLHRSLKIRALLSKGGAVFI
jgi:hypothetical protein